MDLDILAQWRDLIEAAEALEIGGLPLEFQVSHQEELKSAAIALVIHSSRLVARRSEWAFALDVRGATLFVYKIWVGSKVTKG
jgi:hypothetical protein